VVFAHPVFHVFPVSHDSRFRHQPSPSGMLKQRCALSWQTQLCIPHFFFEGQNNSPVEAFVRNPKESALRRFIGANTAGPETNALTCPLGFYMLCTLL
jgi:hypothetical protein